MDLSLGGFMLPSIDLPIVSIKAYAQESSTVNTSPKSDRIREIAQSIAEIQQKTPEVVCSHGNRNYSVGRSSPSS
ncbi:MAG: hypothetical protein QNJ72_24050 [Pleurocapsa sp. MO_226.B13]|nr:hypothetical protein [Pleurocapsa sp. MO_226.B13]